MQYSKENLKRIFHNNQKYTLKKLKQIFEIHDENNLVILEHDLEDLETEGLILVKDNDYLKFPENSSYVQTSLHIGRGEVGYIYVGKDRYTIHKQDLNGGLNHDLVLSVINEDEKKAKVNKVVKRGQDLTVCEMKNGKLTLYGSLVDYDLEIKGSELSHLVDGSRVLVKLSKDTNHNTLHGNYVETLGHKDDPDVDLKGIALSKSFDFDFSKETLKESESINKEVKPLEIEGRKDLRDEIIYTIDCDNTKDMDDAISISINEKGNFIVGVHIADVAHYVKPGTALFEDAYNRATSVYMIDSVIPMIPKQLSNGICSLNPNVDRLTKSCIMEVDKEGNVIDYEITPSVIRSRKKMSYSDVNKILERQEMVPGYEEFKENLQLLQKLNKILISKAEKRGYLSFADTELDISVDEKGLADGFKIHKQKTAEKIIENLMVMANETVASNYSWCPFIYRIHDVPDKDTLNNMIEFLKVIGYRIKCVQNTNNPKVVQGILKKLSQTEEFAIASNIILRGMKKAVYDTENIGHFGLALDNYTHFTSPIRRLPDLLVHTLISMYENPDFVNLDMNELKSLLQKASVHASCKERMADAAEEEANLMKMAEYMEGHIGEHYNGKILNISSSKLTVETTNHIIGHTMFSDIKGDFYQFDKERFVMIGKRNKEVLHIGDKVRLRVKDASKEFRTIDFEISEKLNTKEKSLIKTN